MDIAAEGGIISREDKALFDRFFDRPESLTAQETQDVEVWLNEFEQKLVDPTINGWTSKSVGGERTLDSV